MPDCDYLVGRISDRVAFFRAVVAFFVAATPVLEVWGRLPEETAGRLVRKKKSTGLFRSLFFSETRVEVTPDKLEEVLGDLCHEKIMNEITWCLRKDSVPLALCDDWQSDVILYASEYADGDAVRDLLRRLKKEKVIAKFESLGDDLDSTLADSEV